MTYSQHKRKEKKTGCNLGARNIPSFRGMERVVGLEVVLAADRVLKATDGVNVLVCSGEAALSGFHGEVIGSHILP